MARASAKAAKKPSRRKADKASQWAAGPVEAVARGKAPRLIRISPDLIRPNPWNPNVVPANRLDALVRTARHDGSLLSVPLVRPHPDGQGYEILDGQHRWEAARQAHLAEISVLVIDATDEEARARTVAMNQIRGTADPDKQAALLRDLTASQSDILIALSDAQAQPNLSLADVLGFSETEWAQALAVQAGPKGDGFNVAAAMADPNAAGILTRTARGEIWQLGRHRLMCGDSTAPDDVAALLGDAKPRLMVTDPPYGVEYDPEWRVEAGLNREGRRSGARPDGTTPRMPGGPNSKAATGYMEGDEKADWRAAWSLFPGDVCYCWHGGLHAGEVQQGLEACGFEIRGQIIWVKPHIVISRGHYNWQHEPCFYGVRRGQDAGWIAGRDETTVWQISRDGPNISDHATQKPVECMAHPLRNHHGDVYDPFVGSGTTLIAAERFGRAAFCMEIEPRFCDVVIARWEAEMGESAVRAEA